MRECHGDLHLGNIAFIGGRAVPFDCIEFDPALRWIDVASETAFLVMDLRAHGLAGASWRLLNDWLEATGDYACAEVLRFYLVYRAMVRAKIACLRGAAQDFHAYLALAGTLAEFTGISAPYERPATPELTLCTDREPIADCVERIIGVLRERQLPPGQQL